MNTSRDLFNSFLAGRPPPRPPVVPMAEPLAARIAGLSLRTMMSDAGHWTTSLIRTADLLGLDGIVTGFDATLSAEAWGAGIAWDDDRPQIEAPPGTITQSPLDGTRLATAIETANRLAQTRGTETARIAAMTGPATLALQLFGTTDLGTVIRQLKPCVVSVAEQFLASRSDLLLIIEGPALAEAEIGAAHKRAFATLGKVAAYYNVATALYVDGHAGKGLDRFAAIGADFYVIGPADDGATVPVGEALALAAHARGVGVAVPFERPDEAMAMCAELARARQEGGNFFIASSGPLAADLDIAATRALIEQMAQIFERQ